MAPSVAGPFVRLHPSTRVPQGTVSSTLTSARSPFGSIHTRTAAAIVAVMLSLACLLGTATGSPLFAPPMPIEAGGFPIAVAIGDLNGDGKPDMVEVNYGAETVSVLFGNGDGSFGARTDYGVQYRPFAVALGDLNHDGKLDVVVANGGDVVVSVFLGNGDGTLRPKINYPTGGYAVSVAIGDLNGDGRPDLTVADAFPGKVASLLGNGFGSFGPYQVFPAGSQAISVANGDLNGDGKLDVVVGDLFGNYVSVLLGNGNGTFGPATSYGTVAPSNTVALGDLNGDGKLDVAAGSAVLLGNGDGTLGPATVYGTGINPQGVAIADLDLDGRLDLAVANLYANGASVLLGNGDGTFGPNIEYASGQSPFPYPYALACGDLNGDGRPDLVVANASENSLGVLLNLPPPIEIPFDFKPHALHLDSKGKWVTGILQLPNPHLASQIDVSSIRLNDVVPASTEHPPKLDAGHNRLEVKFSRAALEPTLTPGDHVPVTITGMLADRPFTGTDFIKVKAPKIKNPKSGDVLAAGAPTEVSWDLADAPATTVSLLASLDDGVTWTIETQGIANTGSTSWTPPAIATTRARLAIAEVYTVDETGVVTESELAESDAFTITGTTGVGGDHAELALRPSNPVVGPLVLRFSLSSGASATLSVYDVGGRQVIAREVGGSGPGWHTQKLGDLPAGIYVVRLSQGGRSLTSRVAVVR